MRRVTAAAAVGATLLLSAGCASSSSSSAANAGAADPGGGSPVPVTLGFLTNITHAPALVGLKEGFFAKALGSAGTLKATAFSTGTEETTALLAGQLDAAYGGPNPALNARQKSNGSAVKIIPRAETCGPPVGGKKGRPPASLLRGKPPGTPSPPDTPHVPLRAGHQPAG